MIVGRPSNSSSSQYSKLEDLGEGDVIVVVGDGGGESE